MLFEPGGVLDVRDAVYEAVDDRITRVRGSRWTERPYTMKLEEAGGGAFQTIMFIGIRDPKVPAPLELFQTRMLTDLHKRVDAALGAAAGDYDISLRVYEWSGVSGNAPPTSTPNPVEVGVMFVATAATQELSTRIAKTCNPRFFHFALDRGMDLPSYAFPFSPAEIERGQIYSFDMNHVVAVDNPLELTGLAWAEYVPAQDLQVTYA